MTEWGQLELQGIANRTGARVELFAIPGVGHTSLFPGGKVTNASALPIPVLNHSFTWISEALGLAIEPSGLAVSAVRSKASNGKMQ